jgi:hypothetical protein
MSDIQNTPVVASSLVEPHAELFLTEKQLAKRHQRSLKALRNDRVDGCYIPFIQTGQNIQYRLSDILEYEEAFWVGPFIPDTESSQVSDHKNRSILASWFVDELAEVFLTEKQLAELIQRAPETLRNDRIDGRYIAFYMIELRVRYRMSDVVAYEAAHCTKSTASTMH